MTDATLERMLKAQLHRFSSKLVELKEEKGRTGDDLHVLRRVKAVPITGISRSDEPDEEYCECSSYMGT